MTGHRIVLEFTDAEWVAIQQRAAVRTQAPAEFAYHSTVTASRMRAKNGGGEYSMIVDRDRLWNLHADGLSDAGIAEALNCHPSTAARVRRDMNLRSNVKQGRPRQEPKEASP